jgi:hypothetical protein
MHRAARAATGMYACVLLLNALPVSDQSSVVHVSLCRCVGCALCEHLRAPDRTPQPSRCALPCGSAAPRGTGLSPCKRKQQLPAPPPLAPLSHVVESGGEKKRRILRQDHRLSTRRCDLRTVEQVRSDAKVRSAPPKLSWRNVCSFSGGLLVKRALACAVGSR